MAGECYYYVYQMNHSAHASISNSDLVAFLSSTTTDENFLEKLKIKYRPLVCPFNELLDVVAGAASVFDVGAGSGQFSALVANYTDASDIHGIEIDQRLINNAGILTAKLTKKKKISFSLFDGITIPDDIGQYDLVYMIDVYHHIPTKTRADFMKQIYAKMKVGARIMFKDIDASSPFVACNKVHDLVFAREFGHEISNAAAIEMFRTLGFSILENHKRRVFVYPHYFVLAQK
jgi:2-polyprenyl-3-methyl-5-hydroxy-6-metoxy-1,4-benzoquinol methylase